MKLRRKISVDLIRPAPLPVIQVKKGDSAREIEVSLYAGSEMFILDIIPKIYIKKPDGTKVYNACTLENGNVIIPLTSQSLAVSGMAEAELQMIFGGDVLSTPIFLLDVLPTNIDETAVESSNEFGALVEALQEVGELKENGLKGNPGKAATIQIGTVTTGEAGTQASVSNSGTENDAVLDFVIPRGDKGAAGTVTADTDAIVTYETPDTYTAPASGNTLGTWLGRATKGLADLFAGLALKLDKSKALNTYAEIMAATEAGFWPDAMAVKEGFNQVNSTSEAAATAASEAKTTATAAQQSAAAAANQVAYADFTFTGNSVPANGSSVVMAFSIAKTGYTAIGVTMYAASQYGNGMAYIPVMPDATHCAIFVKNYNGGSAYTASGKVRVAYKKN